MPPDKIEYLKVVFLISQPKHMLWVLKRPVLMIRFFLASKARLNIITILREKLGAQWLSGRVLDSRLRGSGFGPHQRHCFVVLEQDTFILA